MTIQQKSFNIGAPQKETLPENPKNNSKNALFIASVGAVALVAIAAVAYTFFRPECQFLPMPNKVRDACYRDSGKVFKDQTKVYGKCIMDFFEKQCSWHQAASTHAWVKTEVSKLMNDPAVDLYDMRNKLRGLEIFVNRM